MQGRILRGVASEIEAVLWSSDLMGFTALSEALEPRELIPFLNAYSGALVAAVHGEGGDVLKFMGDGLLAIFPVEGRSEEHTSEFQSLMRISYAVFCLKKKNQTNI